MKEEVKDEKIEFPNICPKCGKKNVYVSDFLDISIIWTRIECRDCGFIWNEKIKLF
jgi:predicted Zn-ribbon and HTH transcriptional regulator